MPAIATVFVTPFTAMRSVITDPATSRFPLIDTSPTMSTPAPALASAGRVVTEHTLINRGGTPVARWKAAKLLSDSQVAAIDHCETLWSRLGGKALVMDLARIPGAGQGNGWAEQEALDDLKRIKGYVPAKYWSVYENVCRFDQPAGTAGSDLANNTRSAIDAARIVVMFVADIVAMKERLA